MQMVRIFIMGLQMFSDVGILPSIVQNPHGSDPRFLRTAWTLMIIRGFALWGAAALLAWPFAHFFVDEPGLPSLAVLIPVASATVAISGFSSTAVALMNRKMDLKKITLLEIFQTFFGIALTVALAFIWQSVWVLVIGAVVSKFIHMLLTHRIAPEVKMGFEFDTTYAKEMFHFGKWIFLATALSFLLANADRLILKGFVSYEQVGIYGIAFMMSQAVARKIHFPK